jgi:hypothetical protein
MWIYLAKRMVLANAYSTFAHINQKSMMMMLMLMMMPWLQNSMEVFTYPHMSIMEVDSAISYKYCLINEQNVR